jgi:hypothetical protein
MTAKLTLLSRQLVIEATGADVKSLFRELGLLAEIFEADSACGSCGSPEIRPGCRLIDSFEYFFLHCSSCGAELAFGQRKDGGLFPRRKDDAGNFFEDNGWRHYKPQRTIEAIAVPVANKT